MQSSGTESVCLCVSLSFCQCVFLTFCVCTSVCQSVGLYVCINVYISECLSVCVSVFLCVCLTDCLSVCMFLFPSLYLLNNLSVCLNSARHVILSECLCNGRIFSYEKLILTKYFTDKCPICDISLISMSASSIMRLWETRIDMALLSTRHKGIFLSSKCTEMKGKDFVLTHSMLSCTQQNFEYSN